MVATAIDEKSPYTAGHVQRVAEITEALAQEINASSTAPFADVVLRPDELKELRMAAWLHDVGKIVTPEHVIDKATKLETIFDRIELVRHRVELERKEREIAGLAARVRELEARCGEACVRSPEEAGDDDLSDDFAFLLQVNRGGEFLQDASIERIRGIGRRQVRTAHGDERLLTEDEMRNLSVRKGTLTDEEREIINNHVAVTIKMLDRLPFPKQYAGVPRYAGMHHEKLDGTGYPLGVGAAALPLQARILAVADVFEALTAADRPYKHGKKLSESMKIMGFMARDGHLDPDLCDLIVTSGFVERYAARVLPSHQRNAFEWKGKVYGRNFAQE
jgi:hypothetical protein